MCVCTLAPLPTVLASLRRWRRWWALAVAWLTSFPALIPLFGASAFDDGGTRLAAYLAAGSATAVAFQESWSVMREEVAAGGVAGPLVLPAAMAERDVVSRMQRALTQQREAVAQRRLHQESRIS